MKQANLIGGTTSRHSLNDMGENKGIVSRRKTLTQTKRSGNSHHISSISKVIAKTKAYLIVRGVKSALKEVDLIESGKKKPKSLDQLLNEL